jgi:hypothetical protein
MLVPESVHGLLRLPGDVQFSGNASPVGRIDLTLKSPRRLQHSQTVRARTSSGIEPPGFSRPRIGQDPASYAIRLFAGHYVLRSNDESTTRPGQPSGVEFNNLAGSIFRRPPRTAWCG